MINIYCIRPKGFNIGNDVIFLALKHFIRKSFQQNVNLISLPATGKYESQRKSGLTSQTVYEINQFGHGLIIGGGNLYENGELDVNPTALKALDVPIMVFSLARGKIYNKNLELVDRTDVMTDDKISMLNKKAFISLSRDKATKEYIDKLGCENILGGCPTLFMNEIPQHNVPVNDSDKTDALISIRTPSLMSIPVVNQYEVRGLILQMIEILKQKGYNKIKLLCHDHRDIPFAATFEGIDYFFTEDVYTYLSYLKNTRLNLTFRLHSFLPCLAYDIPAIKISYDQRAISMLETIGMQDWNINLLKDDVLMELTKRLESLDKLSEMKDKLISNEWQILKNTMEKNCAKFANQIIEDQNSK
ncbi:MAG: hypothetical protein CVU00_02195 [Bacteroidetes bacterium HGW-Bacteroidetes-17]|nr:MAG: hypothetical protein CVU00_02195 [Bacteroidetes bacterium HGW-Bacteroidetes-17]